MKDRLDLWAGEFGDAYHRRNAPSESNIKARTKWLRQVLARLPLPDIKSALEVGCGYGANLRALDIACADMGIDGVALLGVEPNRAARAKAALVSRAVVFDRTAVDMHGFNDGFADLAMTCGVLIHIPPAGLPDAMAEIYRVAKRFILCAEYYGREVEAVPYRGEDGALWRRPYGDLWVEQFPDLKPIAQGFAWRRTTGLDDFVWFLFEKP
jgi:pseudaminic acid biosynthesis-associated methylase